ncbi:MAG: family 16 glycosylhydrolase [Candidatus Methylacidiphilales bacterium]
MNSKRAILAAAAISLCSGFGLLHAEDAAPLPLADFSSAPSGLTTTGTQVTTEAKPDPSSAATPCLWVTVAPGPAGYPGIKFAPPGGAWNLSKYGFVKAKIVNTSSKKISVALRIDNPDDWKLNPWNSEVMWLQPGANGEVKVYFGINFGKPGWALKPENVSAIQIFTNKTDKDETTFRVESIEAGGSPGDKPPVDPKSVRVLPKDGFLIGGKSDPIDAAVQLEAKAGTTVTAEGNTVKVVLTANKEAAGLIKPIKGRWDLRQGSEVRVKLRNDGTEAATPRLLLTSNGGNTESVTAASPIAPGAEQELTVSFIPKATARIESSASAAKGKNPQMVADTGTKFTSDSTSALRVASSNASAATFTVRSATLANPPAVLPDWLGKRPPVTGEWVQTLSEEFNGPAIDETVWHVKGPNYYDKVSAYSANNVIIGDGVVKLRYEHKKTRHNDDPAGKEFDYATGYLSSYGKWVQRYGYFEARLKSPSAPGLWPAFWMMPDRGVKFAPEQWKRADTANGGMEFDIFEALTRWGPNRYNVAMHWDGYKAGHKATGSTAIYVQPDKDGYMTTGLLWLPGLAVFYCNGVEVLRWEDERVCNVASNLLFTLPSGGWDNDSLDNKKLPSDFVIDYVRVWQRKDLATPADGKQVAPAGTTAQ